MSRTRTSAPGSEKHDFVSAKRNVLPFEQCQTVAMLPNTAASTLSPDEPNARSVHLLRIRIDDQIGQRRSVCRARVPVVLSILQPIRFDSIQSQTNCAHVVHSGCLDLRKGYLCPIETFEMQNVCRLTIFQNLESAPCPNPAGSAPDSSNTNSVIFPVLIRLTSVTDIN